jgi:hypothetical protein
MFAWYCGPYSFLKAERAQSRLRAAILTGVFIAGAGALWADATVSGRLADPQNKAIVGAVVSATDRAGAVVSKTRTGEEGRYSLKISLPGDYVFTAEQAGFESVKRSARVADGDSRTEDFQFTAIAAQSQQIQVSATVLEPGVDLRNAEVFNRTLFTRDDQVFQQLNAGINTGQHEGGGKSLEIRRFGFNLDHGGVNGGLKVLVDGVQQNQGTQGHGQGYLGALKALSPELIEDVEIINGPFSAEYGDFSGLGVVQIHQRESLPEEFTVRLQGGNFDTGRGFFAYSPDVDKTDAYIAYEGSYVDGPFINPGRYRRDNVNGNYTKSLDSSQKIGFRILYGRNGFYSSGQIPLDLVAEGLLDRFGYIDPSDGGKVWLGTASANYTKTSANGDVFRTDAFVGRSLFDLFSNFTFFLNDPSTGDGIQQHDSRLQEGINSQYIHPHKIGPVTAVLTVGGNYHDNQINVGLYPREGRTPLGVATRAHAHVTNGAGYVQETFSLFHNRVIVGGGLRFDEFRWGVVDKVVPSRSGVETAGRWQPKANIAFTPLASIPLTLYVNYGRGINSTDARGVVERPDEPRLATTDFYQFGAASHMGRISLSADTFLIDHSNEQVYIPDDGTFEFKGPSRAYGFETKASVSLTRHLSLNGGLTKIGNAFFTGGDHRVYVDSAPHFVANAALTLSSWRGFSGSLRMRAVNHYRLDGDDPSIVASGLTVFDVGIAKEVRRGVELNLSMDNLLNRNFYETQNYLESRVSPTAPIVARIHGTPGYPLTIVAGITLRLRER